MCPMGTGSVVPLGAGCVCGAGSVPSLPAVGLRDVAAEGSSSSPSVPPHVQAHCKPLAISSDPSLL